MDQREREEEWKDDLRDKREKGGHSEGPEREREREREDDQIDQREREEDTQRDQRERERMIRGTRERRGGHSEGPERERERENMCILAVHISKLPPLTPEQIIDCVVSETISPFLKLPEKWRPETPSHREKDSTGTEDMETLVNNW
ncbi:hypothetical protein WMY93_032000 [Mugilogobius chulae]|uniref:Uncharacterized protein n=1 Tax=Mugilogobius chulae TaxID=88201 RepID=A0AAW0MEH0_9GOBI